MSTRPTRPVLCVLASVNDAGKSFVVKAGAEKPEEPVTAELGEPVLASPAVGGDALFIRTEKHLWKIAGQ